MEEQTKPKKNSTASNQTMIISLAVLIGAAVAMLLVGLLALKLPAFPVIIVLLIEVGMAWCLQKMPLWLHGIVVAGEIVLGALTGNVVFLIIGSAVYFVSVLGLSILLRSTKKTKKTA